MQSIVTPLQAVLTSDTRTIKISVRASWLKVQDQAIVFATVGSSLVNGPNLVQGQSTVITNADLYAYTDESEYAMRLDYDRRLDEPRGGTSNAIVNVLLDNIDQRFTPNHNATIGTAIEARRPFKMSVGFSVGGVERMSQIIVGLTSSRPKQGRTARTTEVEVFDYITFINNAQLQSAIYLNQRSDQIIEDILVTLGFGSTQYSLDQGINTPAFAWFDKDKSAGRRIRDLCEAEEANFYQDENGVLRFENRNHVASFPHQTIQRTIDPGDILSDEDDESTRIINRAVVIAKPRKVDTSVSTLWTHSVVESIAPGQTITVWAAFYDSEAGSNKLPVSEITTPASTTDYTGNTLANGTGTDRTASLALVVTNFVESAKIEITNNHGTDTVYVTLLQLRGKAARVSQAIQAVTEDASSINKYEAQEYPLQNDLIQSPTIAKTIANNLVAKYAWPMRRRRIRIPGIPHLQLKDLVYVINPTCQNLVPNPSFEVDLTHWSKVETATRSATLERARDVPIEEGYFAAKLVVLE